MFAVFAALFFIYYIFMMKKNSALFQRLLLIEQLNYDTVFQSPAARHQTQLEILKSAAFVLPILIVQVIEFIFLGFAFKYDAYIIPTALMFSYTVYQILKVVFKKKERPYSQLDADEAEDRLEKRKIHFSRGRKKNYVILPLNILYFIYIFVMYIL